MDMKSDDGRPHNAQSCDVCRGISPNLPIWMSEVQLAHYWGLFDENGAALISEIQGWSQRGNGNLLPYALMGNHRRYYRGNADEWAWDQADFEDDDDASLDPNQK